jgi:hypothetical protein
MMSQNQTPYDANNPQQMEALVEPSPVNATTTSDTISESLIVPYKEPINSNAETTYDLIRKRVTVEATPNKPGDLQIHQGRTWIWSGKKWLLCDEDDIRAALKEED